MRTAKYLIIYITCLLFLFANSIEKASAQVKPQKEVIRLDIQFGGRFIQRANQPIGSDIDFMNYLRNDMGENSYGVLSFGFMLAPNDKWSFNTGFSMLSDMLPNHMRIVVKRKVDSLNQHWNWGIGTILYSYPQYLNQFNQYHFQTDTGIIADLNSNYRQRTLFDIGISAMPWFTYSYRRVQATLSSGIGINSFVPFNEQIAQKKQNSNFRREIRYETSMKPALTSHSEAEITYNLLFNKQVSLGLIAKAELLVARRTIPYTRTIYTWTSDKPLSENVKPKKKIYTKTDFSAGLFLKF
ncbi:MAG: hypothetical protein CVT94_02915 [Bacteroidetes bacterium HGW-Bacteroidetes-11]|jgi:hypothetical protein|nr:MAG: hypothetical protein CVT94_02915 [Bacteroidetes bacterium HGW-Bacteroidetes-11]